MQSAAARQQPAPDPARRALTQTAGHVPAEIAARGGKAADPASEMAAALGWTDWKCKRIATNALRALTGRPGNVRDQRGGHSSRDYSTTAKPGR